MKIALITDTYSNATEKAAAEASALVLASNTAAEGDNFAPPGDVRMDGDVEIQDVKRINASARELYPRGNRSRTFSFVVRPKYSTLAAAAAGAVAIGARVGTAGQIVVTPSPEETAEAALVYPQQADSSQNPIFNGKDRAVIRRVKTSQIGVTVEARYEIEF